MKTTIVSPSGNRDFATQIDQIVVNTEQRLLNVMTSAIDALVKEAQTPIDDGGKMRVDTGFLRNSGIASLNAPPVGQTVGRRRLPGETSKPLPDYVWDAAPIEVVLNRMKIGDTFYFGWTARYARYREVFDGFLESAIMNWQNHVDKEVAYHRNKDGVK
jgi:hypothetical protein